MDSFCKNPTWIIMDGGYGTSQEFIKCIFQVWQIGSHPLKIKSSKWAPNESYKQKYPEES